MSAEFTKEQVNKACSLIAKHTGLVPYPEQVKAAKALARGDIVSQNTGEGKTVSVLLAVLLLAFSGRKVYAVTANDYLSRRDYEFSLEIMKEIGKRSVSLKESVGASDEVYASADVIYATGQTLIFDYLRGIKADYDFAVIDEADYILVECAAHDFSVSRGDVLALMPENVFSMCKALAGQMTFSEVCLDTKKEDIIFGSDYEYDYLIDRGMRRVALTSSGLAKLEKLFGPAEGNLFLIDALTATLLVKHFYLKDVHYILSGGEIIIIDSASGRISPNGHNDMMIQTAIEVKEGVKVTAKSVLSSTCAFPVFFSKFSDFSGISGTSDYVPYDFSRIFGKRTVKVKDHFPGRRREIYEYFDSDKERLQKILSLVESTKSPCLVETQSDDRSHQLMEVLSAAKGKSLNVLDNASLEKEKELLGTLSYENAVLVSSRIVGRGTDITIPPEIEGGLTVILANRLLSERSERQMIGRTGRNGKNGTAYILSAPEDDLFRLTKERRFDEKQIKKLQDIYEQKQYLARKHIYCRSRLFFEMDAEIAKRISSLSSYEELIGILKKSSRRGAPETAAVLGRKLESGKQISDYYRYVLLNHYRKLRPVFQQQFICFNDLMPEELYTADGFHHWTFENLQAGIDIIAAVSEDVFLGK